MEVVVRQLFFGCTNEFIRCLFIATATNEFGTLRTYRKHPNILIISVLNFPISIQF